MKWVARPTFWILLILATMVYGIAAQRDLATVTAPAVPNRTVAPAVAVKAPNAPAVAALATVPEPAPAPLVAAMVPPPVKVAEPPPIVAISPSFDVVRVAPSGSAVLAGRAAPGAEVTVRDGDTVLGRSYADTRGEWVLTPADAIEPGGRALSLAARDEKGAEVVGAESLVVIVPPRATAAVAEPAPVMAVVVPDQGPARVVQSRSAGLALQTVDYDDQGEIRFAGTATAGARLQLYIDNALAGAVVADASGRWSVQPLGSVLAGVHTVRLDQMNGTLVEARIETPFQRDVVGARASKEPAVVVTTNQGPSTASGETVTLPVRASAPQSDRAAQIVVQPGQNLWRLARTAYGEGTRYTLIFTANQGQIRDPNLIYPGQAFNLPAP